MERYKVLEASLLPANFPDTWPEPLIEVVKAADAQATVEALQAQVKELLEALDCVLVERPLPSGEYVHRVSCNGDRRKPAGTVGISCSCRVGQQQVEALQREVKALRDERDRLREALERISTEHCAYKTDCNSPYDIGVVDGHRCAATIAKAALAPAAPPLTPNEATE